MFPRQLSVVCRPNVEHARPVALLQDWLYRTVPFPSQSDSEDENLVFLNKPGAHLDAVSFAALVTPTLRCGHCWRGPHQLSMMVGSSWLRWWMQTHWGGLAAFDRREYDSLAPAMVGRSVPGAEGLPTVSVRGTALLLLLRPRLRSAYMWAECMGEVR